MTTYSNAERVAKPRAIYDKNGSLLPSDQVNSPDVDWELIENADGQNDKWKGVGVMVPGTGKPACTLTLIEPPGKCASYDKTRKAIALTNGHCVTDSKATGNLVSNKSYSQTVKFNHFHQNSSDAKDKSFSTQVATTIYASQKGKDLGILELTATYEQLLAEKIFPKRVAKRFDGTSLTNVGFPYSGIDKDKQTLHKSKCSSRGKVALAEGGAYWPNQFSHTCSVVGGSSGSGLFNESTDELMGLVNTGTTRGDKAVVPCSLNEPCELAVGTANVHAGMNYGFDVTFLHKCFNNQCVFDPKNSDCSLATEDGPNPDTGNNVNDLNQKIVLDHDQRFKKYQVKMGLAGGTDCQSSSGYEEVSSAEYLPKTSGDQKDGIYILCVRGQNSDGTWQDLKNAATRPIRLDRSPPVAIVKAKGDGYVVAISDKDDRMAGFVYKFANSAKSCREKQGYRVGRGMSAVWIRPRPADLYLCVRATDVAGNEQSLKSATVVDLKN